MLRSLQFCLTLLDPMDHNIVRQASLFMGILQARILEWIAMPSSRGSSQARDRTQVSHVSCIGMRVLYHCHHLGSPSLNLNDLLKTPSPIQSYWGLRLQPSDLRRTQFSPWQHALFSLPASSFLTEQRRALESCSGLFRRVKGKDEGDEGKGRFRRRPTFRIILVTIHSVHCQCQGPR